jgi:hypothetical protein
VRQVLFSKESFSVRKLLSWLSSVLRSLKVEVFGHVSCAEGLKSLQLEQLFSNQSISMVAVEKDFFCQFKAIVVEISQANSY